MFGWSSRSTKCPKSDQFDNRTKTKSARFQTLTVLFIYNKCLKSELVCIYFRHSLTVWFPNSLVYRHKYFQNASEILTFYLDFRHFCVISEIWTLLFGFIKYWVWTHERWYLRQVCISDINCTTPVVIKSNCVGLSPFLLLFLLITWLLFLKDGQRSVPLIIAHLLNLEQN